jgi:glycosyltransferase 2 family protein
MTVPALVSVVILMLLYSRVDMAEAIRGMAGIHPAWAGIYLLLVCMEPSVRGLRWQSLLGQGGLRQAILGMYIAKAGNNLFPLRIGDAIRVQYVRDRGGVPYRRVVSSLVCEMLLDTGVLALLAVGFTLLAARKYGPVLLAGLGILAAILVLSAALLLLSRRRNRGHALELLGILGTQLGGMLSGKRGLAVLLRTAFLWAYTILTAWCGLRILLPDVSFSGAMSSVVLVYFAALIPSAPGFIGSYHAAVAASLEFMGYSFWEFASLPVVVHALQFIPQTLLGLVFGMKYLIGNDWRKAYSELNAARSRLMRGEQ